MKNRKDMQGRPNLPPDRQADGCAEGGCDCGGNRREFLGRMGAGALGLALAPSWRAVAGPFTAADFPDHHVPLDKKLNPDWVRSLTEKGERTWYAGDELRTIGMPVGGVCAGQLYLSGDGRLIYWDIFNRNQNTGYGAVNYKEGRLPTETVVNPDRFEPALDLDQGFALRVQGSRSTWTRSLDRVGFPEVRFCGEYPLGTVEYRDPALPVEVTLEAFSPFVPLDTEASTLPATLMRYTVTNRGEEPLRCALGGWLENRICPDSGRRYLGRAQRVNSRFAGGAARGFMGSVRVEPRSEPEGARPSQVFADFEQDDYGGWRVEGEAFGARPAQGTLSNQNPVSGFLGRGLVNSYLGGSDRLQGRLVSPEFVIERRWIGFLVGGGGHGDRTCMNLVVNGEVVRTVTGRNEERLSPENWLVDDLMGQRAHLEIIDRESGGWGHINIDQIEFRDEPMGVTTADLPKVADYGTMALAVLGEEAAWISEVLPEGGLPGVFFGEAGLGRGGEPQAAMDRRLRGGVGVGFDLEPGAQRTLTFVVTWCLPNLYRDARRVGNAYGRRFANAMEVAEHVGRERERLVSQTRLWHDTYYDSSLPWWLLDRLHSTVSILASATCQWWEDGRFWAWEGCGCCHGTCGHVWNYEQGLARLFPDLERSVRERQDFAPGIGFNEETGAIGFRGEGWDLWAGDSQGGYILKAYREHLCSVDDGFLRRNWPRIRKAVEFLMEQDGDADGLIEGRQHQTYDQDYFGANTFVGALYLGALRAAEAMAQRLGEGEFAERCRRIFESGRRLSMERLFNGEYFIQQVDLDQHPDWQYAEGCLADQLFGQSWAHQVGLGYLYPVDAVRRGLTSIWQYCWSPDVGPQNRVHAPERWFARPGEGGLFTCTWPKSRHLGPKSTRYRDEIWTGIEYQVAHHMAHEGMVTEALAICRAVHERYHPLKRNPWNEIECGDHYARAMASWGLLISLAGFEYDGPAGRIGFAPRVTPGAFACVFTGAEGWGRYAQRREADRQVGEVGVAWGRLRLRGLRFELPEGRAVDGVRLRLAGRALEVGVTQEGPTLQLELAGEVVVDAGQVLAVAIGLSPAERG